MSVTPYMNLTLPTPNASDDIWDDILNAALTIVDSHNHSSGQGLKVPASGINLNADIAFNGYNIDLPRAVRLTNLVSVPVLAADICTLAAVNDELYYIDGVGNQVQLTSGGALNAAALGAIGGDYGASTALLAFYNSSETFVFTKDTNEAAPIDCGPVVVRDIAASALGITLQSPVGLSGAYSMTLLPALPAAGKKQFIQIDDSGVTSLGPTLPGSNSGLVTIDSNGDISTVGTLVGSDLTLPGDLTITGAFDGATSITLDGDLLTNLLVPVGAIIPFYDFNGLATFNSSYWAYCNGATISNASSTLDGQTLPDLSGRYLVGFGTDGGGDIGSATWATATVGNAGNTVDLSHTHYVNTPWGRASSTGSPTYFLDPVGTPFWSSNSTTAYQFSSGGSVSSLGFGTHYRLYLLSDSQLSASQSIQPISIRVRYIMRIV
ncbi:MAG: hypothetical protein KDB74_01475 [Flavobacteriales bacterium]|nr:hypothetical protein [Flavobacteriales bacterium]